MRRRDLLVGAAASVLSSRAFAKDGWPNQNIRLVVPFPPGAANDTLARAVSEALAQMENVEFIEDKNSIRLEARRLLEELLAQEERIDAAARQKIENQRRTIMEGSQEWDILYRKYYNEEVKKLGI